MTVVANPQFNFDQIDRRTKQITPALIEAIRDRIVQHLQPRRIVLFGSQASGEAKPGSDIDLLIVLADDNTLASLKRRERLGRFLDLFRYRSFGLDAFIFTESEIRQRQKQNEGEWDIVLEVLKKGKVLYDRAEEERGERARSAENKRAVSQGQT